jgi:fucose permease
MHVSLAMIVGCLIVPLARKVERYELVLLALFMIASGITVLQVAAGQVAAGQVAVRQVAVRQVAVRHASTRIGRARLTAVARQG